LHIEWLELCELVHFHPREATSDLCVSVSSVYFFLSLCRYGDHHTPTSPTYFANSPNMTTPPSTGFVLPPPVSFAATNSTSYSVPPPPAGYAIPTATSLSGQPPPVPPKPYHFAISSPRQPPPPQSKTAAGRDDTYAIPADTLPPSARARVIQPMKKSGMLTGMLTQLQWPWVVCILCVANT
jgi:hypothetical protein